MYTTRNWWPRSAAHFASHWSWSDLAIPALRSRVRRASANGALAVGPVSAQAKRLAGCSRLSVKQAGTSQIRLCVYWLWLSPMRFLLFCSRSSGVLHGRPTSFPSRSASGSSACSRLISPSMQITATIGMALHGFDQWRSQCHPARNCCTRCIETALRPKYDRLPVVQRRQGGSTIKAASSVDPQGSFWIAATGVVHCSTQFTLPDRHGYHDRLGLDRVSYQRSDGDPPWLHHSRDNGLLVASRDTLATFGYRIVLFLVQCGSAASLYFTEDWNSFIGAIGIALSLPPLAFPLISGAMRHDPIK